MRKEKPQVSANDSHHEKTNQIWLSFEEEGLRSLKQSKEPLLLENGKARTTRGVLS